MENKTNIIDNTEWTTIIKPHNRWFRLHLLELIRYRDLIMLFVHRDFVSIYKQTILGPIWFLLQPLMTTLVFTIIFGRIAKISTDGIPPMLFYMSGTVVWTYFANCINSTSRTFISSAQIFSKVYFPRLCVPISIVISNLISFALQFVFFLAFILFFYLKGSVVMPTLWVLYTPLLIIQMAALGLGTGLLISAMTTKYRDLQFVVSFGVQLWMYATPIVYPLSVAPPRWQWVLSLNPMAPVVEIFRHAFLGSGHINLNQLGISIGVTTVLLVTGILMFNKVEKNFVDTV